MMLAIRAELLPFEVGQEQVDRAFHDDGQVAPGIDVAQQVARLIELGLKLFVGREVSM